MTLPTNLLDEVKDLKRRVADLERNPQPPNISLSDTATASFTVDPLNGGNYLWILTNTLDHDDGKRIMAVPNQSLYKDSVSAANLWPSGSNWSIQDKFDLVVVTWVDWGSTDNNNVVTKMMIQNWGSSTFNLIYKCNHRFLLMESNIS